MLGSCATWGKRLSFLEGSEQAHNGIYLLGGCEEYTLEGMESSQHRRT